MQLSLQFSPDSHHFPFPWKTNFRIQNPTFKNPERPLFKSSIRSSNSLKTSFNYESEETEKKGDDGLPITAHLPVVIRKPGSVFRYFWDGNSLQLLRVDGDNSPAYDGFPDKFGNFFRFCSLSTRNFFIPQRVNGNYMDYVKWKFLHRVFSSALQVLATQAMFRAIGIGYSRSLPSAAALNWVLKDGLGRLSRCIYTASLASAFDTNLKRVRFTTSVLFSLSIGVEMLTPVFPQYFLLLASIANIAKQISLACYLATNSAVHQSFAIADNLGEISAKAQIQTVCFDNLGLMLAALLNILCKNNQRLQAGLPFVAYPIFSAIDLFGIHQGLKHVHLQTLTKNRLEIIMNTWIQLGYVPSPAEVSKEEGIDLLWSNDTNLWPIRIGCLDPKDRIPRMSMLAMRSLRNEDFYFICMEICCKGQKGILLCVREGASTTDVSMGLLQACYIRKRLLSSNSSWNNTVEAYEALDLAHREWFELIEDSKWCAQADSKLLIEQILASGWSVKNVLLSTQEQARYSFLDD